MAGTAQRIMRLFEILGLESSDDPLASDDPLLATLMAAITDPSSIRLFDGIYFIGAMGESSLKLLSPCQARLRRS